MHPENKRFLVVLVVLALSAGLTFYLESTQKKLPLTVEFFDFPLVLGSWTGEEIPVSQRTLDILESPFVIIRKYSNPQGEVVYFSGVFSSHNRKAIHPPEICLTGGGVSAHKGIVNLKIGMKSYSTNRLEIISGKLDEPNEVIFYWYKAGDKLFTNFYAQQLQITWDRIRMKNLEIKDVALLRISTSKIAEESEIKLEERLKEFAEILFAYLKL